MTQTRIHTTARLYINAPLREGALITLSREDAHYLLQVMRKKQGDALRVFNGYDGEWLASLLVNGKKDANVQLVELLRKQAVEPDIRLVFAPLKHEAMHFVIEKATELGVSSLYPVFTDRTVVQRLNGEKLSATVKEAAEQCERFTLPSLHDACSVKALLEKWPENMPLLLCDEMGSGNPVQEVLSRLQDAATIPPLGVLIGPEGGFTDNERMLFKQYPFILPVGLGPRILRADTAAIAALACIQSMLGDWQAAPRFNIE